MHGGGAAALRAHRAYLAISHGIIVLSRSAWWEGIRTARRAIFATAVLHREGASMSGTEQAAGRDHADGGARRVIDTSVAHSARVHGDQDDPGGIIRQLMAVVPAGSYLALSQVASDIEAEQMAEAARRYNRLARETQRHRSHAEVVQFFDDLELLEPGVVPVQRWRPASEVEARARSAIWGGVGRKSGDVGSGT
jgi:hypothetical protein